MASGKGFTNHVNSIDSVHDWIHKGLMFSSVQYNGSVADDGAITYLIQVAAGQEAHLRLRGSAGGDAELAFYEGPTFSDAGSAAGVFNRKRSSVITPQTTITTGPTVSNVGTLVDFDFVAGGIGRAQSVGGDASFFQEWILTPGENYLFRMTNIAGTAQPLHLSLDWYEPLF